MSFTGVDEIAKKLDALVKDTKEASAPAQSFTEDEIQAIRDVKAQLLTDGVDEKMIHSMELSYTVLTSKLRLEESVEKYKMFIKMLKDFGVDSVDECWGAASRDGGGDWKEHHKQFKSYAATGRDSKDRSVMWIKGNKDGVPVEQEKAAIRSSVLFVLALHGDLNTLRNGLTFVIDTGNQGTSSVGNEAKMQRAWQSFPLRPQAIYILGAGRLKRVVINGLIYVASLFTKSKVIQRIEFTTLEHVKTQLPLASVPVCAGGQGGGVTDINAWVQQRIRSFPRVDLD